MPRICSEFRVFLSLTLAYSLLNCNLSPGKTESSPVPWKCEKTGTLRSIEQGKELKKKASYCWRNKGEIIEQSCFLQPNQCAVYRPFHISAENYEGQVISPSGSPGFKLCQIAGGDPRFEDFLAEGTWHPSAICYFREGGYSSIDYWMRMSVRIEPRSAP